MGIHTFLLGLEKWIEDKKRYPRKIFWQVDGGPENCNRTVLAVCEYLVAKTDTQEIYLTRLPVGHTHEDIDAVFGTIWEYVKGKSVSTPQEYKSVLESAFKNEKLKVYDIFSVPDYKSFFGQYIDPNLGHWTKLDEAKLQWRFQKTEDPGFPLKVKSTYRAFAQDDVILILSGHCIPKEKLSFAGRNVHYQGVEASIRWEPRSKITSKLTGQFQLIGDPKIAIGPAELVQGSRAKLNKVFRKFYQLLSLT